MKFTEYAQGTPCWVDLGSNDLEASKAFYSQLFGWNPLVDPDPQYGGYAMCHLGEDAVAGLGPVMSPDQPVVWTSYLAADSTDATVAAVRANGGTVLAEPFDIGAQGRMAIAADPTGGVFGIWQKGEFAGAQRANEPNTLTWNELRSSDPAAAIAFYEAVFGLNTETTDMGGMPYTSLKVGDKTVGGLMGMEGMFPPGTPSHWMVYFAVDDADATGAKTEKLGGKIVAPAMEAEGVGRWITLQDPQGAMFSAIRS